MHIALVSQEYPPGKHGGIGAQTKVKADGLTALGHTATVITHNVRDEREAASCGNVRTIRLPGYDDRLAIHTEPARWITYSVRVAEELARLHQGHPLDLIDFPEWAAEGYAFLLNRTVFNYVPAVVQLHGPLVMFTHTMDWPKRDSLFFQVGTHMESTCVCLADAVYSSSRCSIDWCSKHYGLAEKDVPVLHTGVDADLFRPCVGPKERRPTIVFVGKLVENKGVLQLAEAARDLLSEFPDLQLWMIGGGDAAIIQRLEEIGRQGSSPDFLHLRGFARREELPKILSRAHIFAAPSIYEGGPGFVYLEAMSCGLPVVACSGSGASEVITPGRTGFLVPPKDLAALTDTLRPLLSDEALRDSIGRRAREYVLAEADSKICLRRLVEFYEAAIDCSERRRSRC
jgi:glycosyltransferase involved in cell wall biosynthesis